MIALGHAIHTTPVRAGADAGVPPHGLLAAGERVAVSYEFPADHPTPSVRGWTLVKGVAYSGWAPPGAVKRLPLFMVDASHHNGAIPNWHAVWDADRAVIGIKISEGTNYPYAAWGRKNWGLVRAAAGDRYGVSAFRIAYHWGLIKQSPEAQVEYFLSLIAAGGGWGPGDLLPVLDLERPGNDGVTAAELRAWVKAFTHHMLVLTGWPTLLYAGSFPRALAVHDLAACGGDGLWFAEYAPAIDPTGYTDLGYTVKDLFGWQYAGDKASGAKTIHGEPLPYGIPGYDDDGKGSDSTIVFCRGFDELVTRWGAGARHL